jgi:exopolysaccharide biosynthesis polyprenyl glycosylphosphotransferase
MRVEGRAELEPSGMAKSRSAVTSSPSSAAEPSDVGQSRPRSAATLPFPRLARRARDAARHDGFATLYSLSLFLFDVLALIAAFVVSFELRGLTDRFGPTIQPPGDIYLGLAIGATLVILTSFALSGFYRLRRAVSRMDEFYKIVTHVSLGMVVAVAGASFILGDRLVYSRQMLVYGWLFAIAGVTIGHSVHTGIVGRLRARGVATDRLLIVGAGATGRMVLDKIRRSPQLGYDVVAFVRHTPPEEPLPAELDGIPLAGMSSQLAEVVEAHTVDEIIVAISGVPHEEILDLVYSVSHLPVSIRVYPDSFRLITADSLSISDLNGLPTVSVRTIGLRRIDRTIKRAVDVVVSITVLVALSPILLLVALLVKLSSPGPVFFVQERVGQDGRAFQLLKFRSMPVDAERASGPVWTAKDDPRPTRVGRVIRRYSLDELPQFINVLLGDMSVVGPRPERPFFVEQFSQQIPAYMARHHEKSGVTGWAQVNGLRGDTSIAERTRYDLYYVENWSLLFDLKIMVKTIFHIFRPDNNAY